MQGYVLSLYPDFACIAERCPATCCVGWKITVDPDAYLRYERLEDDDLRQDILGNLVKQNDEIRFANVSGGACPMLDPDGLCRIQRNTQESMLCNTCRKYPRLSAVLPGTGQQCDLTLWLSLAASCPVVAQYVLGGEVSWLYLDQTGHMQPLSVNQYQEMRVLTGIPGRDQISVYQSDKETLFDLFVDIAVDVLDILLPFRGIPYLEHSLDLYEAETPDLDLFCTFFRQTEQEWERFMQGYTYYRYPSRYLECPDETRHHRTCQVQGELLLMRIMLCSRYGIRGELKQSDWLEVIHWVYRFCIHGERMAEEVHHMFLSWQQDWLALANQNVCLR